jgi:EmrB/QacA subfamily drug resistance transporter
MIFLINLPIGIMNVGLAIYLLKETNILKSARMDFHGFFLAALAFPCLLLAISRGESNGWTSPTELLLVSIGVVALVSFITVELRKREPLLELRLFRNKMFGLAMGMNFITQFSLFGLTFILPLFLQTAHRLTPAQTGLVLLPSGAATWFSMNFSGKFYNRLGPRPLAMSGLIVMVAATGLLSQIDQNTPVLAIAGLASMRGVAMGLCMMPVQTLAFNTVPRDKMSRAPALTNVLMRLFGSSSTAVLTIILVTALQFHGAPAGASITGGTAPIGPMVSAFSDALWAMCAMSVVGVCMAVFLHDEVLEELWHPKLEPVLSAAEDDHLAAAGGG